MQVTNQPSILEEVVLVRLPEMYYILAEVNYSKDKEKALDYLNAVRGSRGLADIEVSLVDSWINL